MHGVVIGHLDWSNSFVNIIIKLQPNRSTTAILGMEESGDCREVAISRSFIISYFTAKGEKKTDLHCIAYGVSNYFHSTDLSKAFSMNNIWSCNKKNYCLKNSQLF